MVWGEFWGRVRQNKVWRELGKEFGKALKSPAKKKKGPKCWAQRSRRVGYEKKKKKRCQKKMQQSSQLSGKSTLPSGTERTAARERL